MWFLLLYACSPSAPDATDTSGAEPCAAVPGEPDLDAWGGDRRAGFASTGVFATVERCGRWWLVDPDGGAFYSFGVNAVTRSPSASQVTGTSAYTDAVARAYPDGDAWAAGIADRYAAWGLNTVGSWSEDALFTDRLPTTKNLGLSGGDWETGAVADWWDPAWEADVEARVAAGVEPGNPFVLGYFLDNEIRWGTDWRGDEALVELYLELPATSPGKAVAVDALYTRYGDLPAINAAMGTEFADREAVLAGVEWAAASADEALVSAFLTTAADRYFGFATDTIRAHDPDHLVLGNRESAPVTRREVYVAQAAVVDVISVNRYVYDDGIVELAMQLTGSVDPAGFVAALAPELERPFLVTEFGFRAADSGLPNTWPPFYPVYATQAARADAFEAYATEAQAARWVVGYHWFELVDQPAEGRFDGEDNNWGVLTEGDVPYEEVTSRMARVNAGVFERLEAPLR